MAIDVPTHEGLICGFRLHTQAPAERLLWDAVLPAIEATDSALWLHFDLTHDRARDWLATCDRIPLPARNVLLATDVQIRLEALNHSIFGVLGDIRYDLATNPEELVGALRLYADDTWIITGRLHPLQATDQLRRDLLNGLAIETSIQVLAYLFQRFTGVFGNQVAYIDNLSNAIEDRILKGRLGDESGEIGRTRRLLVCLRRLLSAEQYACLQISARSPRWCSEADVAFLQREVNRLDEVAQDLESLQERVRLLQEEIAGQREAATDRNLYFLSIVTIIFLPITLISGIFGMNVGGLPWAQDAWGFWWVMLSMGITLGIVLIILRRWRFF